MATLKYFNEDQKVFFIQQRCLLAYLMSNPGRVYSRTMIIEHVWDDSFEGLTNSVDDYLRHLRKKIDDPFQKKLLRTIRGVGYSINPDEAE